MSFKCAVGLACAIGVSLVTQQVVAQPEGVAAGQRIEELKSAPQGSPQLAMPSGKNMKRMRIELPGGPQGGIEEEGQYSSALQAYFVIRWYRLGQFTFPGARLLSYPDQGSPLRAIGMRPGDIITRLDNVKVYDYDELDRHYADTSVRYVRYPGIVRQGNIYIDADLITP